MQDVKTKEPVDDLGRSVRELLFENIAWHLDQERRRKQDAAVSAISNAVHEIVAQYIWLCVCLTHLSKEEREKVAELLNIDLPAAVKTSKMFQNTRNLPHAARKQLLRVIQQSIISSSADYLFQEKKNEK